MIYTSYMGNLKNIPDTLKKVSIMRFTPEWANQYVDEIDLSFAPLEATLLRYQNREIDKKQYVDEFNQVLNKLNPRRLKKKLTNSVLLCTCKLGKFCHRHLIADYLRIHNVMVEELEVKESLIVSKVETVDWLSVKECKRNPDKIFVFGDNSVRLGKKGQAVIRDCSNSFGIATKRYPSTGSGAYFKDSREDHLLVMSDLKKLRRLSFNGNTIVFPKDGLGLGLANMGTHSPYLHIKMYLYIEEHFMKHLDSKSVKHNVIIAGGREFNNFDLLTKTVDGYIDDNNIKNINILTGDARGADKLGNKYAKKNNYYLVKFPADWDKHGKSAGYVRNSEMAIDATDLIVFWDGKSRGTKNMIDVAKKKKIKVKIVRY